MLNNKQIRDIEREYNNYTKQLCLLYKLPKEKYELCLDRVTYLSGVLTGFDVMARIAGYQFKMVSFVDGISVCKLVEN